MALKVLITGANGYIAQHVVRSFLEAGHTVRGVVRSAGKADQLRTTFAAFVSGSEAKLDFSLVQDISAPGAFDEVLRSTAFDAVIHTASPFNYRIYDKAEDFLRPAVDGTTEILRGVARAAPSVRRVVVTSSMASVIDFGAPKVTHPPRVYTEADWNPVDRDRDALAPGANINVIYQASKKYAELAAWRFVEEQHPGFDLVVLNPPMVFGPLVDPSQVAKPADLGESVHIIYRNLLTPGLTEASPVPPTGLHLYVDVRDLAHAHLLAATVPAAGGKRFVVCGGQMSMQRAANILREALPALRNRIPRGEPDKELMPEGTFEASSARAKDVLGLTFRTPRETIADLAGQLVEIEERGNGKA